MILDNLPKNKMIPGKANICKECRNRTKVTYKVKSPDIFRQGNDDVNITLCDSLIRS